jgi:hypothetical protein
MSAARPAPTELAAALAFTFAAHGLAMLGMLAFLLPGMPGGGELDDARRVAYIAGHPGLWRLGWLGWQVTAVSDLWLGVALLRTRGVPRLPAILTLLVTLCALAPDQYGQALWITRGVELARTATATRRLDEYLAFEQWVFPAVAGWGATLYTLGALGWTWCFAAAGTWSRPLTWLSVATWGLFGIVSPGLLLPPAWRFPAGVVSAANALGFLLMELWFLAVLERVVARAWPDWRRQLAAALRRD